MEAKGGVAGGRQRSGATYRAGREQRGRSSGSHPDLNAMH